MLLWSLYTPIHNMSTTHRLCTPHLHHVHEYTTSHRRPTSRIYSALRKSRFHCIVVATTLGQSPDQSRDSHTSWPLFCTPADDRPLSLHLGLGNNCKRCPTSLGAVLQFYLQLDWNHSQDAQEQPLHIKELHSQHTLLYSRPLTPYVYIRSVYECTNVWPYTLYCVCVLACTHLSIPLPNPLNGCSLSFPNLEFLYWTNSDSLPVSFSNFVFDHICLWALSTPCRSLRHSTLLSLLPVLQGSPTADRLPWLCQRLRLCHILFPIPHCAVSPNVLHWAWGRWLVSHLCRDHHFPLEYKVYSEVSHNFDSVHT